MKNGDMPAMPFQPCGPDGLPSYEAEFGLTKREMMAMHIASGLMSNPQIRTDKVSSLSVKFADELLAELERTGQ